MVHVFYVILLDLVVKHSQKDIMEIKKLSYFCHISINITLLSVSNFNCAKTTSEMPLCQDCGRYATKVIFKVMVKHTIDSHNIILGITTLTSFVVFSYQFL